MRSLSVAVFLALTGCASVWTADCRSANWAEIGERDGLNGVQARLDQYNQYCGRQNVAQQEYMDAWWVGNATYRDRTAHDGGM